MSQNIYILGGHQSDFAKNCLRENIDLFSLFADTVKNGLKSTKLEPKDIKVGHVSNFVADLFTGQAHLGGFFGHVDPALKYLPASRHEAACASGSMALLAAMADLEAGRYDLACVLGIEMMRNVPGKQAAENLRPAAWVDKEWCDTPYVWPCAFDQLIQQYDLRYGIDHAHLNFISEKNYANARNNPNAQTRNWAFKDDSFKPNDDLNPVVSGSIRRQDCGQISDGAAVVFLANESRAKIYAKQNNLKLKDIPLIKGWGHVNAPMLFEEKIKLSDKDGYLFPHVHQLFEQTLARASMTNLENIHGLEVHDCFNITEYMVLDHCALFPPGEAWKAIEDGVSAKGGSLPFNMSGGLIGGGHPVGATGVRMALDAYKQVARCAGDYQIEGADNIMTFNLGGSTTTCASLIIGR